MGSKGSLEQGRFGGSLGDLLILFLTILDSIFADVGVVRWSWLLNFISSTRGDWFTKLRSLIFFWSNPPHLPPQGYGTDNMCVCPTIGHGPAIWPFQ